MPNQRFPLGTRSLLLLGGLTFVILYHLTYVFWLNPNWEYLGFTYSTGSGLFYIFSMLLALLPLFWMSQEISRPTQLIYWWLYTVVYVPSCLVPSYTMGDQPWDAIVLSMWMTLGFLLVGIGYRLPLHGLKSPNLGRNVFWVMLWLVIASLHLWVMWVYQGNLRLVAFDRIYDEIRFSGGDLAMGTGVSYAVMWLAGSVNPFLMSIGLFYKRPMIFCSGAAGQVLLYGTAGMKSILLSALLLPALYILLKYAGKNFGVKLVWATAALFLITGIYTKLDPIRDDGSVSTFPSLIFCRTYGISGLLTSWYHDFFQHNPKTYFSHASGINLFVNYPYHFSVGVEVGHQPMPGATFAVQDYISNVNAHFWAMDGIASLGDCGIPIASLICVFVFWMMDSVSAKHHPHFCALVFSYGALNFSNVSIFTCFLSGGIWLSILILFLMPSTRDPGMRPEDCRRYSMKLWI